MNIEEKNMEESIRSCGKNIFHVHVADSNRWYPGAGHLDFQSILTEIFNTGYEGWISGEVFPRRNYETATWKNFETNNKQPDI